MAGAIRQPIDIPALQRYIEQNVPQIKTPLEVKQFGFGQSNPTYLLISPNGARYVMRKKPPGKLLSKTAHQVDREYTIIHALEKTGVPVPKAYCLCEDESVVGTAFYIMEFLDGRIITDSWLPDVSEADRTAMQVLPLVARLPYLIWPRWRGAVETLAKFHRVDFRSIGLEKFGRHSGFYDRQLKTFGTLCIAQAKTTDVDTGKEVGKIPHFDEMVAFFSQKLEQPTDRSTLIHGDYKIDNLVFHKTEPRVIGILDWEMATIGHPLSDFVNLTGPYSWGTSYSPDVRALDGTMQPAFKPGVVAGLPSVEQCMKWYADVAGWDPTPEMPWGNAFGGFRGAVIMQGIAARYARRQASGQTAREYGSKMGPYGEHAWASIQKLTEEGGMKARKAKL